MTEPVTLQVGSRPVIVETTPLPATPATFRTTQLRADPQQLTFTPDLGWAPRLLGAALLGVVMVALVPLLGIGVPWSADVNFLAAPLVLFFGLVAAERWLRTSRFTFDRESRQLRFRLRFSWPRERPLDGVLAAQVLAGEVYSSDEGPDYQQYQLNIVLDDAVLPRLNVSNHPNLEWTRASGRQLADFLGIPLLDHVS